MFIIHRKLFLALKKVQIVKITHPQVRITPLKNSPPVKFPIPPTPYCYFENSAQTSWNFGRPPPIKADVPHGDPLYLKMKSPPQKNKPLFIKK